MMVALRKRTMLRGILGMASCIAGDAGPEISDPACVPDTFVEGIGMIEVLAGYNLRITAYQSRDLGDGVKERQVALRVVISMMVVPTAIRQVMGVMMGIPFMSDSKAPEIVPH
jgi:hypothetical protein